jgi:hypothetical protein
VLEARRGDGVRKYGPTMTTQRSLTSSPEVSSSDLNRLCSKRRGSNGADTPPDDCDAGFFDVLAGGQFRGLESAVFEAPRVEWRGHGSRRLR